MNNTPNFRDHLGAISSGMGRVHRLILENEIEIMELKQGISIPAATRLQLLLTAPELAWLRALSQAMAAIDEIYFQKEPITEEQARTSYKLVDELLIQPSESDFFKKYRECMSTIPDLMIDHGHLRVAMRKFNETLIGN